MEHIKGKKQLICRSEKSKEEWDLNGLEETA